MGDLIRPSLSHRVLHSPSNPNKSLTEGWGTVGLFRDTFYVLPKCMQYPLLPEGIRRIRKDSNTTRIPILQNVLKMKEIDNS